MAKFTIKEVIDAIRKNGLPQAYGTFFSDHQRYMNAVKVELQEFELGETIFACALGQAAYNLDVKPEHLIKGVEAHEGTSAFGTRVFYLNDESKYPLNEIADLLEDEYADYLNDVVSIRRTPSMYKKFKEGRKNDN